MAGEAYRLAGQAQGMLDGAAAMMRGSGQGSGVPLSPTRRSGSGLAGPSRQGSGAVSLLQGSGVGSSSSPVPLDAMHWHRQQHGRSGWGQASQLSVPPVTSPTARGGMQ